MKSSTAGFRQLCLVVFAVMGTLALSHSAVAASIVKFDAPGAGTDSGQGTFGAAINSAGVVVGYYVDSNAVYHGFVRATNGTITPIDAPGAGTAAFQGTWAFGINKSGVITGYYFDASNVIHGYVKSPTGHFAEFEAPGAQGTLALEINNSDTIAGTYFDANNVKHGFVRVADGTITTFDAPGAGTGSGQGTITPSTAGINNANALAGWYVDDTGAVHGYERAANGTITPIDALGAGTGPGDGTYAGAINDTRSEEHTAELQ